MRKRLVCPAVVLGVLLAMPGGAQVIDRVLAVVDGRLVTLSDVRVSTALGLIQADEVSVAADRWIETPAAAVA